jgi:hypothetical protein
MLSIAFDEAIDLIAMLDHTSNQTFTKGSGLLVRGEILPEEVQCFTNVLPGHIDLVKNLEGKLPPTSPNSQI